MTDIYVVYLYCDYHKEVNIQHLMAFGSRDQAIEFVEKYADTHKSDSEYVSIRGTEYDAPFLGSNLDEDDEDYDNIMQMVKQFKKELNIKKGMWYLRIAVDKVALRL